MGDKWRRLRKCKKKNGDKWKEVKNMQTGQNWQKG